MIPHDDRPLWLLRVRVACWLCEVGLPEADRADFDSFDDMTKRAMVAGLYKSYLEGKARAAAQS